MSGKIMLVRHGEPDVKIAQKISGNEISKFLELYNAASIKKTSFPPEHLKLLVKNTTIVMIKNEGAIYRRLH